MSNASQSTASWSLQHCRTLFTIENFVDNIGCDKQIPFHTVSFSSKSKKAVKAVKALRVST
jgi:hypothetical protein